MISTDEAMDRQCRCELHQRLYRSEYEHDACGVGMVANLSGVASHDIVEKGLTILKRLMHRGATGNDPETGDGAGLLMKIPHEFFRKFFAVKNEELFGIAMIFGGEGEEATIEAVLNARGYELPVVTVHSDSVNVVVRAGTLERDEAGVILELVMRETGVTGGNVKIIPIN